MNIYLSPRVVINTHRPRELYTTYFLPAWNDVTTPEPAATVVLSL
jgi:hypothetical protein